MQTKHRSTPNNSVRNTPTARIHTPNKLLPTYSPKKAFCIELPNIRNPQYRSLTKTQISQSTNLRKYILNLTHKISLIKHNNRINSKASLLITWYQQYISKLSYNNIYNSSQNLTTRNPSKSNPRHTQLDSHKPTLPMIATAPSTNSKNINLLQPLPRTIVKNCHQPSTTYHSMSTIFEHVHHLRDWQSLTTSKQKITNNLCLPKISVPNTPSISMVQYNSTHHTHLRYVLSYISISPHTHACSHMILVILTLRYQTNIHSWLTSCWTLLHMACVKSVIRKTNNSAGASLHSDSTSKGSKKDRFTKDMEFLGLTNALAPTAANGANNARPRAVWDYPPSCIPLSTTEKPIAHSKQRRRLLATEDEDFKITTKHH